jgi:steroid delta-isomerase-like uncharacterized protein
MSRDEMKDVSAAAAEAIGKSDYDALDRLMAPELAAEFRRDLTTIKEAFPDYAGTNELYIVEGEYVVTRWVYHGTHHGTFLGIPPTGKRITFTGISIDRLVDGKIVETAIEMDMLGVLRQLGATTIPQEDPFGGPSA